MKNFTERLAMDIELLNFCHWVCEQNPIRKKIFQEVGCSTLLKNGVTGFRSTTWWSSPICRARLAAIFGKNEKAYNAAMSMSASDEMAGGESADKVPFFALARELRDRYGAPLFDPSPAARDFEADQAAFKALNDWMISHRDDEAVAALCREKLQELQPQNFARICLRGCNDKTAAEFAEFFWSHVGPAFYYYSPAFQAVAELLPIPDSMKDGFAALVGETLPQAKPVAVQTSVDKPAHASTTESPDATVVTSSAAASVKSATVSAMAKQFRDERTPALCRAIIDGLTAKGYFAAAEDYSLQLTYLVSNEEETEEAAHRYLLAVARNEGRGARLAEEVKAFREDFPRSMLLAGLDAELDRCAASAASLRTNFFDRWAAKLKFWQQPAENQAKLIRRAGNALLAEDKINALEFLLESLKRVPDNGSTRQMLSQAQAYLRLTAPSVETLKDIASNEMSSNTVEDAWSRLVDCLMADGRVEEAKAEFDEMKRQRVSWDRLESLQQRFQEVWDGARPAAPKAMTAVSAAPRQEVPKAPVQPVASQDRPQVGAPVYRAETMRGSSRPDVASLPYPRRFIGAVKHFNNYINFHPKHVEAGTAWLQLTPSERTALFPKWGGLALRFANASAAASLKEGRLFIATFERSDFLPTQDSNYVYGVDDPKIGEKIKPLSSLGCVIVRPCEADFDLARDTFVQLDVVDEAAVSALDGEMALLETKEGLVGPFRLRANSLHCLYVAKVPMKDLGDVTLWRPTRTDSIIQLSLGDRMDRTMFCRFALTETDGAFVKGVTDLVKEGALLQAVVREIPQLPAMRDLDEILERSTLLGKGDRLARVQRMFDDLQKTGAFVAGLQKTAVACVLERLKKEASLAVQPVTEAVTEAISHSPELARLTETLRGEMAALRAQHETALREENARFQSQLREFEQTIEAKEQEVGALDGELKAKKDFLEKEIRRVVADAKTDYSRHKLSPYFDGLETFESEAAQSLKAAAGDVDFAARSREAGALIAAESGTPAALRRHLIDAFRARRGYSHDETVNLFVSLANNFLTIFSGEPGCGKTSACGILADALGLTDLSPRFSDAPAWQSAASCDRFLAVPVERGWTSKRDFLGYFNPLTQSFSASDRRRYEAFRLLSEEAGSPDAFPFVFLLDEANLSPMEYYWADFMGICGGDARASREIVLGDSVLCRIPDHLRFLATVNIDDTTEPLSPRLLDRAWIIRLPDPEFNSAAVLGAEPQSVRWKDFTAAFGAAGPLADVKAMQPYYEHMRAMGLTVSMRSRRAIAQFIAVGTPLFDGGLATAVDYAVAQKLLPMVRGSGAAFKAWLEDFRALCEKAPVSAGIVDHILTRGSSNLNFFQFF